MKERERERDCGTDMCRGMVRESVGERETNTLNRGDK